MSASVYIFDLRGLDKPTHTTPARRGGKLRPHYSTNATLRKRRAAAREAGGIDRIVLHQWAAEVDPLPQSSDRDDALKLASFYWKGIGVAEDRVQARGLYQRAAKLGSNEATEWLRSNP